MADTPLHIAVKHAGKTLVKNLLEKGYFINAVNSDGNTPLHIAFLNKQEEIIDLLLYHIKKTSNYANLKNNQGISHLHIASTRQDKDIVKGFLECNCTPIDKNSTLWPGFTPLDLAIEFKSAEVAQYLAKVIKLKGFANIEERNIIHKENPAFPLFHSKFFQFYHFYAMKNKVDQCNLLPYFHFACLYKEAEVIETMIRMGADVNEPMSPNALYCGLYTPLHVAIQGGASKEVVQLLLDNGADPNRRNSHYMTALHLALYTDDYRPGDTIVDRLYAAVENKEADLMDLHGLTYLHIACTRNDVALVTKLLDQGADVNRKVFKNVRCYSNFTLLHFAALYRREEMAKVLIERGAQVNFDDVETPLHLACLVGHKGIIELLLEHGADPMISVPQNLKTVLHLLADHIIDTDWADFYNDNEDEYYNDDSRKMELLEMVERMVQAGVDVNEQDDRGYTALHCACTNIYEGWMFADTLMKSGADINRENNDEKTPLQLVMEDEYKLNGSNYVNLYHCVQRLKALGLEVNPKNEECCQVIVSACEFWENNDLDWLSLNGEEPQAIQMPKREKERNDEIMRMKETMLTRKISLYDFVKLENEMAAGFVNNKVLKRILHEEHYEVYGYLIELQYWKALKCAASKINNVQVKREITKPAKTAKKRRRV